MSCAARPLSGVRRVLVLLSWWVPLCATLGTGATAAAQPGPDGELPRYRVRYEAQILPGQGSASVRIRVTQDTSLLREMNFAIDPERYFDFSAEEGLEVSQGRVTWFVPARGGELRYTVRIDHLRDPARYDARCTTRWALFRGEDLFPAARTRRLRESEGRFRLRLRVPPDWQVLSAYPKRRDGSFTVHDEGSFAQPQGWFLAGEVRALREEVAGIAITVGSPEGDRFRDRDLLALLRWVAPELRAIVPVLPERLLVVGAGDPMWRGGLSGPNSLYVHSDRPLLDKDWTSPLLHELMHVVMRARSQEGADWIVEGLAEYYALELLRRSGTISEANYRSALSGFETRGEEVETLRGDHATGAVTARAVIVFHQLDTVLRERSKGRRSLDDLVRGLREDPDATHPVRFRALVDNVSGSSMDSFWRRWAPSLLDSA